MANEAIREPEDGADANVWAPYLLGNLRAGAVGQYSCQLYDDSGALKVSKGLIGINNGTTISLCKIDTVTTISLSGLTAARWAQIEMETSGTSVTFSITSIAAGNDASALPAAFTGAYDGDKQGFYINATKRCIGLAWINTGGDLEGIVNVMAFIEGYIGWSISDDANDNWHSFIKQSNDLDNYVNHKKVMHIDSSGTVTIKKVYSKIVAIGDWDMNATDNLQFTEADLGVLLENIIRIDVKIIPDNPIDSRFLTYYAQGGIVLDYDNNWLTLSRLAAGHFDSVAYDSTSYNRGWIYIDYYE